MFSPSSGQPLTVFHKLIDFDTGASPLTSHLRVALIDTQDLTKTSKWSLPSNVFSNRTVSLAPSSLRYLNDVGAWDYLDLSRVQPYGVMEVWDGANESRLSLDLAKTNNIATIVENANLVSGLMKRIEALQQGGNGAQIDIFSRTTVSEIENGQDERSETGSDGMNLSSWPVLSLTTTNPPSSSSPATNKKIAARLLVGADGINSPVRTYSQIAADGWDYDRHGVVASLELDPAAFPAKGSHTHLGTAYQRFLPELGGPIAMLPLPYNHASLVWSTTTENAKCLKSLSPQAMANAVNAAFRLSMPDLTYILNLPNETSQATADPLSEEYKWRLQKVESSLPAYTPPPVISVQANTVASFPLRYRHTSSYISPRIALVGDAAHTIHPLAGLGLNLGLGDVAALTRTIEQAVAHGADIGALLSLEAYPAERYLANAKTLAVCDALHKAYNVNNGLFGCMRGLGLNMVDKMGPIKDLLMKEASG